MCVLHQTCKQNTCKGKQLMIFSQQSFIHIISSEKSLVQGHWKLRDDTMLCIALVVSLSLECVLFCSLWHDYCKTLLCNGTECST